MADTHVVFGATGALGAAIVRNLVAAGKPVRAVVRNADRARRLLPEGVDIAQRDAADAASAALACHGAAVVYPCFNVPYPQWQAALPGLFANALHAARKAGARLVFPGNVYVYGPFQTIPADEEHPRAATTRKGRLRAEIEATMLAAHEAGEVPVVVPRMPDFYGPNVTNRLYGSLFESALAGKPAMWVASADQPHDLVFIDDAAAACVLLGATESAYGQAWHIAGFETLTGRQFIEMIFGIAETRLRLKLMTSRLIRFAAHFDPVAREIEELLYLWEQPQVLDGSKFATAFPSFAFTPHEEAVRKTLEAFRSP